MLKRSIGLTIFGAIFILLGIISAILPFIAYIKFSDIGIKISAVDDSMNVYPLGLQYFLIIFVAPLALAGAISYIITGIGLLGLRYWAWYMTMAAAFSKLFSLANPGFIFGWQAIGLFSVVIQLGFLIFIFSFFKRRKIKEQFALNLNRFRFKSWYGILVIFYLILPLVIPLTAIVFKAALTLKTGQPFLLRSLPQSKFKEEIENLGGAKRREIFNLSFLAPQDFTFRFFNKAGNCAIGDSLPEGRGWVIVGNRTELDDFKKMYRKMKFKNTYEFEKALYSNNWAMILVILREHLIVPTGDDRQILMFETSQVKGFIKSKDEKGKDRLAYDCSIYDKNNQNIGNVALMLNSKYFTKEETLKIISSIRILKNPQAAEYYQKGLRYLAEGDMVSAQIAFAQAYYLSPQNVEYAYLLAETLYSQDDKYSLNLAQKILGEAIELKPDYLEAQNLLEMLNQKNK